MKELLICSTYDESFDPMCAHFCSSFRNEAGIKVRLNRIRTEGKSSKFGSKEWYENLKQKTVFLGKCMNDLDDGEVMCCSDMDIQFFKPRNLLRVKWFMEETELDYMGQKEHIWDKFNGGFFFIKKNTKMVDFVNAINSSDISKYKYAEQELINEFILSMKVNAQHLNPKKYLHGCLVRHPEYGGNKNVIKGIVMHHATCAFDVIHKMKQMNEVRKIMGLDLINWDEYFGYEEESWKQ